MKARAHAVALAALVAACAARKPPNEPAAHDLDVPKIAVPAPKREASRSIVEHWPFDASVRVALYADVATARRLDIFRALTSLLDPPCADAISKLEEVAAGADERGLLVLARFAPEAPEDAVRRCTKPLASDRDDVAVAGSLAFFGARDLVRAAVRGGGGAWPAGLVLDGRDRLASWTANAEGVRASGGVNASSEHFRADVKAELPEDLARMLEERLAGGAALGPLARMVTVARNGGRLEIALELKEPPVDQARDLGILGALATHGVRAYLTRSKVAEARSTLAAIARAYVVAWEREGSGPPSKRKLTSFPPVPKTVPRGTAFVSSEADWAAWKPLHFVVVGSQRFQYEIVAAKDGESADILARGDLDGDGKTSSFRVTVRIDRARDTLDVAPNVEETDPDE